MLAFNNGVRAGVRSCTTCDLIWQDVAVNRKIAGVDEDNEAWQTCTVACLNIQAIVVIPVVCEFNVVCNETMLSGTPTGPMQTPDTVI